MKKQTESQKKYQQIVDVHDRKRPVLINCVKAFIVGGIICMIGNKLSAVRYPEMEIVSVHSTMPYVEEKFRDDELE